MCLPKLDPGVFSAGGETSPGCLFFSLHFSSLLVTKRRKGRPDKARDRGPGGVLMQYVEEAE